MNTYGIFAFATLIALCIVIPILSENEERVKLFLHDLMTCLRCIARGEDL